MSQKRHHERLKRRRQLHLPVLLTLLDLLGILLGLISAYMIRFHNPLMPVTKGYILSDYINLLPIATVVLLVSFYFAHLYRVNEKIWGWRVAGRIIKGCFLAVAIFVTVLFFFRSLTTNPLARPMIPLALIMVPAFVMVGRWTVHRKVIIAAQRSGRGLARALVIGVGAQRHGDRSFDPPPSRVRLDGSRVALALRILKAQEANLTISTFSARSMIFRVFWLEII